MYAIHLPWSSLFCEQAFDRQGEGSLVLWQKRTSSHEDGAGKREGMSLQLWPSGWRERASCPLLFVPVPWIVSSLTRPRQSLLLGCLRKGATLRSKAAGKRSDRQDSGASTGLCPPVGKFHATLGKAHGIPGSAPSVLPLQKNRPGRLCRAWLPRKKTL